VALELRAPVRVHDGGVLAAHSRREPVAPGAGRAGSQPRNSSIVSPDATRAVTLCNSRPICAGTSDRNEPVAPQLCAGHEAPLGNHEVPRPLTYVAPAGATGIIAHAWKPSYFREQVGRLAGRPPQVN
jgi:hypothetical protein